MLPTCRSQLVGHIADPDHVVILPKTVVPPVVHVLVLVIFVHPTDYPVPNQGIGICDLRFEVKLLHLRKVDSTTHHCGNARARDGDPLA